MIVSLTHAENVREGAKVQDFKSPFYQEFHQPWHKVILPKPKTNEVKIISLMWDWGSLHWCYFNGFDKILTLSSYFKSNQISGIQVDGKEQWLLFTLSVGDRHMEIIVVQK